MNGTCGDVFIFQIGAAMNLTASTSIILTGGVVASSVYWQVGGAVTIGARYVTLYFVTRTRALTFILSLVQFSKE